MHLSTHLSTLNFDMVKTKIEEIFLALVLTILIMPLALTIIYKRQFLPIDENRTRNVWPDAAVYTCLLDEGEYAAAIGEYFDDVFVPRDFLIRTKNELNYLIFGITGEDSVYIGNDGYLFLKSVVALDQIKTEKMTNEELNEIIDALVMTKGYLDEAEVKFLFMFPPQKNEAFPEWIRNIPVYRPDENKYIQLLNLIEKEEKINCCFINTLNILRESQNTYPVYYKTDFHWNAYGATQAFIPVVNKLSDTEGIKNALFGEEDFDVFTQDGFRGGQLKEFPILEDWTETAYYTKKNSENDIIQINEKLPNGAIHWINLNEEAPLGAVLFIGDSYTNYMVSANSGILDNFKEIYKVHVDYSEEVLLNYSDLVDYVVYERIESSMPMYAEDILTLWGSE